MSRPLNWGHEPNMLRLKIADPTIKPAAEVKSGLVLAGVVIEMPQYNVDDLLCQMLDDYGEDELIRRIKALQ